MKKQFLRRTWKRYPKLGKGRKKKQVWRSPKGRHNKMRLKRKGYPSVVGIGYKKEEKNRGKIEDKKLVLINNLNDLKNLKKGEIAIIGKIGKKKKLEIIKKANSEKIEIKNVNIKKFLKEIDKKEKAKTAKKAEEKKKEAKEPKKKEKSKEEKK